MRRCCVGRRLLYSLRIWTYVGLLILTFLIGFLGHGVLNTAITWAATRWSKPPNVQIADCRTYIIAQNLSKPSDTTNGIIEMPLWRPSCVSEKSHLAYIKVHKCAGDTLASIFRRFAFFRNLTAVLPRKHRQALGWPYPLWPGRYRVTKTGEYNILADHCVYDEKIFSDLMPPETVYVTSIRHPFSRLKSAFRYWSMAEIMKITHKPDPLLEYLKHIEKYDGFFTSPSKHGVHGRICIPDYLSMTRNAMVFDLGYPLGFPPGSKDEHTNMTYFNQWLSQIKNRFQVVIITEYFDESLVLLKRLMCWNLQDILYYRMNSHKGNSSTAEYPHSLVRNFQQWSHLDYLLYNHFNKTLWGHIKQEGPDFWDEVKAFHQLISAVDRFCKSNDGKVTIAATDWNGAVTFTRKVCGWLNNGYKGFLADYYDRQPHKVMQWTLEGAGC